MKWYIKQEQTVTGPFDMLGDAIRYAIDHGLGNYETVLLHPSALGLKVVPPR